MGPSQPATPHPTLWEYSEGHLSADCKILGAWPTPRSGEKLRVHMSLDCKHLQRNNLHFDLRASRSMSTRPPTHHALFALFPVLYITLYWESWGCRNLTGWPPLPSHGSNFTGWLPPVWLVCKPDGTWQKTSPAGGQPPVWW